MKITKPESRFRDFLSQLMKSYWRMSWHEDGDVSPGIPDLHYVMRGVPHRVGWLELKAVDGTYSPSNCFDIKATQHQYIRKWNEVMPIHFLVRVEDTIYLIHSEYHHQLAFAKNEHDIRVISMLACHADDLESALPQILSEITKI